MQLGTIPEDLYAIVAVCSLVPRACCGRRPPQADALPPQGLLYWCGQPVLVLGETISWNKQCELMLSTLLVLDMGPSTESPSMACWLTWHNRQLNRQKDF